MDFKVLRVFFLVAVVMVQAGCATSNENADDSTPALEPTTSPHDDSHGWGANLQGASH
jgi:hypothetical protein